MVSLKGTGLFMPYTVAEEENTNCFTPCARITSASTMKPYRLLS